MFRVVRCRLPVTGLLKVDNYLIQSSAGVRNAAAVMKDEKKDEQNSWVYNPDIRYKYPDFLPHPYIPWRNPIKEKIERADMLKRRKYLEIPEFYVGSILAVTSSTIHAPQRSTKFVGICIIREGTGLNSRFILRNMVNGEGVECVYEIYDPQIQSIEVLKLEKRLDDKLFYLRDAEPEYSTFPFDMEPEYLPEGAEVPVNPLQVKLKEWPGWRMRQEKYDWKGVLPFEMSRRRWLKYIKGIPHRRPTEFDLMWHYRESIPEEEQKEIFSEVAPELLKLASKKNKIKKKVAFVAPKKTA